jgi:dynein heavy chain
MSSSIKDLKKALNGEIGMSADLDVLGTSFFNGQLPPTWAKLAPSSEK